MVLRRWETRSSVARSAYWCCSSGCLRNVSKRDLPAAGGGRIRRGWSLAHHRQGSGKQVRQGRATGQDACKQAPCAHPSDPDRARAARLLASPEGIRGEPTLGARQAHQARARRAFSNWFNDQTRVEGFNRGHVTQDPDKVYHSLRHNVLMNLRRPRYAKASSTRSWATSTATWRWTGTASPTR